MAALGPVRSIGLPTVTALVVAIVAVSSAAPLIAYAAAPALAIAFWRNALAVGVISPVAAVRRRDELTALLRPAGRSTARWCVLAGVALAVHFGTWVPSAKMTNVASATALVCTQPVWTGLFAVLRGVRVPRTTWLGIGVAVLGAAAATGVDVHVSAAAVTGDLLALAGGVAGAVYTTYGERARARMSTTAYTAVCYPVCAATLGVVCLVGGVPLSGYGGRAWLAIVALTICGQLLGHTLVNYSLLRVSATSVSVLLLLEAPGAALIGWALLDQVPPARSVPGLAALLLGVAVVLLGAARRGGTGPARRPAELAGTG
jgi:drug/metabolite transporter (DMT)-like permease